MAKRGPQWIRFLRQYGPIARNDNMYDEHIRRSAARVKFDPLLFKHPIENELFALFSESAESPTSVVLTGTAGDGKTHLCRQVWHQLGGDGDEWDSDRVYHHIDTTLGGHPFTVHIVRDLTGLPETGESGNFHTKTDLLEFFSHTIFTDDPGSVFLIAANDGQLIDTWARLNQTKDEVDSTGRLLEDLLFNDLRRREGKRLTLFNLSRIPSATLFDRALEAFLNHDGWKCCYDEAGPDAELFGECCPIRRNLELLKQDQVRDRLRALLELCDHNEVHLSIRRILLLLTNAVLGFAGNEADGKKVGDRLMKAVDVPRIIATKQVSKASIYNNIFGGNLTEYRRNSLDVFEYLNRFRIGRETSNRFDNLLIYGHADEQLKPFFDELLGVDKFYGADEAFLAAQQQYIEGADEDIEATEHFLELLMSQRRALFFKIPNEIQDEFSPWDLTVFSFAGEYLDRVVGRLTNGKRVEKGVLARLTKGLNRVFIGMLVTSDRELLLATGLSGSAAKVSCILEDRVSVTRRISEQVEILLDESNMPILRVSFTNSLHVDLRLTLTRFEFLSRVAEGVLPGSFSKECHEDILAFKSRLLTAAKHRRQEIGADEDQMTFRLLELDELGNPLEEVVELDT
ncbi:MAG: ATP-binding protein [Pirellulales bacterium]|nr:ATP-binding protein [Pirellulales bacterium]